MKKRVIVYGLGKRYEIFKNIINERYEVIGVTSSNPLEKEKHKLYLDMSRVSESMYDYIIICSSYEHEILERLMNELNVSADKIKIDRYEFSKRGLFNSQYGEDGVLLTILEHLKVDYKKISYLELGTNDPIVLNNTYALYRLGARGILVEPNRKLKRVIELIRPEDKLINKAVSLDGKPTTFFELHAPTLSTTIINKYDKKLEIDDLKTVEEYEVETITINDLFIEFGKTPDVISIDVEDMDYPILNQIDFNANRPMMIIAEIASIMEGIDKEFVFEDGKKIKTLLEKNNYLIVHENRINAVFIDKKYYDAVKDYIA